MCESAPPSVARVRTYLPVHEFCGEFLIRIGWVRAPPARQVADGGDGVEVERPVVGRDAAHEVGGEVQRVGRVEVHHADVAAAAAHAGSEVPEKKKHLRFIYVL